MNLTLFNTLGRARQQFEPINHSEVGLYSCGPTVYNYAHIGNLRAYIFVDILRRTLEFAGYPVKHVMNVTDVGHLTDDADDGEDKMVKSSRESGRSVWDIAEFYTEAFFRHIESLNIRRPHVIPRATQHIQQMIELIQSLEQRGYTYTAGGNVYFDISKFPSYGQLVGAGKGAGAEGGAGAGGDAGTAAAGGNSGASGNPGESSHNHSRVEEDPNKKNPGDFVLWFTRSKFENQAMLWDSPWGRGYPGWHVECSAMSMYYLGEQFDIHCGGVDHIAVHHSNEIAQSEGATGRKWVNYWLHNEFLVMERGKMAKSAGGFITLDSVAEAGYDPLDYRYFCLLAHYRSELSFSWDALSAARSARLRLIERVRKLREEAPEAVDEARAAAHGDGAAQADDAAARGDADGAVALSAAELQHFRDALADDLNTPRAVSSLWGLVKSEEIEPGQKLLALGHMDMVLGLALFEHSEQDSEVPQDILDLVEERAQARKARNFARADEIRDTLTQRGYILEDGPDGTRVRLGNAQG